MLVKSIFLKKIFTKALANNQSADTGTTDSYPKNTRPKQFLKPYKVNHGKENYWLLKWYPIPIGGPFINGESSTKKSLDILLNSLDM